MTVQLRGVLTALATPFTADDSVDEPRLRALVDRSIEGGVHGVVACGSTGEFSALSSDERRLVVETVVDQTKIQFTPQAQFFDATTSWAAALQEIYGGKGAESVLDGLAGDLADKVG